MPDLTKLRAHIDELDDELLKILSERLAIARDVAAVKKETNAPILDASREQEILAKLFAKSKKLDLTDSEVEQIWKVIFEVSRARQRS